MDRVLLIAAMVITAELIAAIIVKKKVSKW